MNYEIDTVTRYSGHFILKVYKASNGQLLRETSFDNLILNNGLNRLGLLLPSPYSNCAINGCAIGTGTSSPAVTQTALDSLSAYTTTTSGSSPVVNQTTVVPYYHEAEQSYRFSAGVLNGNYSEIGVGWANNQMFSRALILDGNGQPTTITVLSDEFLEVTYRLRLYIPDQDVIVPVTITGIGSDIPVTIRPFGITSTANNASQVTYGGACGWGIGSMYSLASSSTFGAIGDMTEASQTAWEWTTRTTLSSNTTGSYTRAGNPNGKTISISSYVTDSFRRDIELRCGLDSHNATLKHLAVGYRSGGSYQYLFDTSIPKTSNNLFNLNVRISWARRVI